MRWSRRAVMITAGFAAALLGACDDGSETPGTDGSVVVDGGANDAGEDALASDVGVVGMLTADPPGFSVASVAPGDIHESSVTLTNNGAATVAIEKIAFGGSAGIQILWRYAESNRSFVGIDLAGNDKFAYPVQVAAGRSLVLIVEFRPREPVEPSGNVVYTVGGREFVLPIEAIAAEGRIDVDPPTGELGRVLPGTAGEVTFTVGNVGAGVLDFTAAAITFGDPEVFKAALTSGRQLSAEVLADPDADGVPGLSPESEFDVTVTYTPSVEGGDKATLTFLTNDIETPELDIPLVGNLDDPCISADPPTLVWAGVVGVDSMVTVNIKRCTPATLTLTSVGLRPGTPGAFTLLPEPPVTPAVLDTDDPFPILVHFVADEARMFSGTLEVLSDDEGRPSFRIPLTATAE